MQRVRVLFKFAFDNGSIDRPVRYGQNFKTPSRKTVRIDTPKGQFVDAWIALDWLREQGWAVCPDVPQFTDGEIGYITTRTLKDRGWTPKLIEKYLTEPDKELPNPHYKVSGPMRVYAKTRVTLLKRLPAVAERLAKSISRKKSRSKKV